MGEGKGLNADQVDRAVGCLLGAACGDALGVPYEFGSRALPPDEQPRMLGGGLGPYAPGEYSDDTQMAVVIAQVASTSPDLRAEAALEAVAQGWIDWLQTGASDVGVHTSAVLSAAAGSVTRGGTAARLRAAARERHTQTGRSGGNGSLMRTAPVALRHLDDPAALSEAARSVSELTHPDEWAGDACVLWCQAIRTSILHGRGARPQDGLKWLPGDRRTRWVELLEAAEAHPPGCFAPNGSARPALQAAWSATCQQPHSHEEHPLVAGLSAAVHAGDDTDTVGAIAGALLGAQWGAEAIPERWLRVVHGWPGMDAAGLRDLAVSVVQG
ncbi:MAG: ADP-ribosylglycohydrolase family protein [Nocardioidaceae bacterium]